MKFPHLLALVATCVVTSLSAADGPASSTSADFISASLQEPGKQPDVSMLPTLPAVTSVGMPTLSSALNSSSTRVPESGIAGMVALFGYILILRRRTV